jgi:hypothetical protein
VAETLLDDTGVAMETMQWVPEAPRVHALHAGGQILARVAGEPGARRATRTSGGATLALRRVGFVRPRTVLRPEGGLADVASLESDWDGEGRILFPDGRTYRLARESASGGDYCVRDEAGRVVLRLHREGAVDAAGATVAVEPAMLAVRDAPDAAREVERCVALAVLGWNEALSDLEDPSRPVTVYNGADRRRSPRLAF